MLPPKEDHDLQAFQETLLDLLSKRVGAAEVLRVLKSDPRLSMYLEYIDTMEPRMIELATVLFTKWGRTQAQLEE